MRARKADMEKDLIDFPCAPNWVRHYAERGMTPDYPADFYDRRREDDLSAQLAWALRRVADLEQRLADEQHKVDNLKQKLATAQKRLEEEQARRRLPQTLTGKVATVVPIRQVRGVEL